MSENDAGAGLDVALADLADHPSRGSGRINKAVMAQMAALNVSQVQIAEFFAVSEGAVSRMKGRLGVAIARDVATGEAGSQLLQANLLSGARLVSLAEQCEALLKMCRMVAEAEDEWAADVVEARNKLRRLAGSKGSIGAMAISLMGEARKQLEFVHNIQRETYNLRRVEEFQQVVMDEIKAAAPEVQQRIMARLNQVQAFRSSLEISGGGADFAQK